MDKSFKFDQDSAGDVDNNKKKIPYRLCCKKDRIKVISTSGEPERLGSREVLRLSKVNSVDIIKAKTTHDSNSIEKRSVTSLERRNTHSLYLPYLLGNKVADVPTAFNKATYRSFRTQEERKCLAFTRSLQRDHKP